MIMLGILVCSRFPISVCMFNNNNNNCLKSNIQCIEIRVQWTVHLGSSHMHVHVYCVESFAHSSSTVTVRTGEPFG